MALDPIDGLDQAERWQVKVVKQQVPDFKKAV